MTATTTTPEAGSDARTWRIADLSVLLVLILGLVAGAVLRDVNVNATQTASFEGLSFDVPSRSLVQPSAAAGEQPRYLAVTADALVIRVEKLPAPASADKDPGALVSTRALALGKSKTLFRSDGTGEVQAAGRTAGLLQYQYVEATGNQVFAGGLEVRSGYEAQVPDGDSFYAVSLEAPQDTRAELDAMWPRLLSSVRLGS